MRTMLTLRWKKLLVNIACLLNLIILYITSNTLKVIVALVGAELHSNTLLRVVHTSPTVNQQWTKWINLLEVFTMIFRLLICNVYVLFCISSGLAEISVDLFNIIYILDIVWWHILHFNCSFRLILWEIVGVMILLLDDMVLLISNSLTLSSIIEFRRSIIIIVTSDYIIAQILWAAFWLFIYCQRMGFLMSLYAWKSLIWIERRLSAISFLKYLLCLILQ